MRRVSQIAFVAPWYGASNGGAEVLCRSLARRLADDGRDVEVWTTCSRDPFHPWDENFHEPGLTDEAGVGVRRFRVDKRDADAYVRAERELCASPAAPGEPVERTFFDNSINSRDLRAHVAGAPPGTLVCFLPYLYGTTVNILPAATGPSILIPCLHDEPFAYTERVQKAFERATGALFLSGPEQRLAATMFDLTTKPHDLLGVGVERERPVDAEAFRRKFGVEGPFALYCGRKVPGKGFDVLLENFAHAKQDARFKDLKLVASGAGEFDSAPYAPLGVIDLGFLSDDDLRDAMAAATVFCQPSLFESFSIVLMQAWLEGRPALVNGACDVTREHCVECNGGLWFTNRYEFTEALAWLLEHPEQARQMGENGRAYVERSYNWRAVVERFNAIVSRIEEPASTPALLP